MKTEDLVSLLAAGVPAIDHNLSAKRFSWAMLCGGVGSTVLMAIVYGVRPDIGAVMKTPLFWIKLALPVCLALAALLATARLSRPGSAVGRAWAALAAPVLAVWIATLVLLWLAPPDARLPLVMGNTWRVCPRNIALLSVPVFITVFWAMRGLAPTRLRLAGAAGGLLAGATAAVAYCFHCPEMGVPFWAVWYLLGMLIPTLAGVALGPRLLKW
ncbi:DUF1109 domain-containing protein [Paraburkholderia phytofirmans]|uniref:DUF1109 domain-containing protein n=1 Tax=Paraburkholderia phytofirmans TaxID=261302 RepID=A0ABW9BAY7_9BURK